MLQDARIEPAEAATVMLSQADYDATVRELETLRTAYHANLAALEDVTIDELRIAHLKRLLASATVVAGPETLGAATLGSVVRARKDDGCGGRLHARRTPRARLATHARHARFAGGQGAAGRAQRRRGHGAVAQRAGRSAGGPGRATHGSMSPRRIA